MRFPAPGHELFPAGLLYLRGRPQGKWQVEGNRRGEGLGMSPGNALLPKGTGHPVDKKPSGEKRWQAVLIKAGKGMFKGAPGPRKEAPDKSPVVVPEHEIAQHEWLNKAVSAAHLRFPGRATLGDKAVHPARAVKKLKSPSDRCRIPAGHPPDQGLDTGVTHILHLFIVGAVDKGLVHRVEEAVFADRKHRFEGGVSGKAPAAAIGEMGPQRSGIMDQKGLLAGFNFKTQPAPAAPPEWLKRGFASAVPDAVPKAYPVLAEAGGAVPLGASVTVTATVVEGFRPFHLKDAAGALFQFKTGVTADIVLKIPEDLHAGVCRDGDRFPPAEA